MAATGHAVEYTVRPGDTLWSIAQRADPTGDPRVLVARMAAATGSSTVQPGEHIVVPEHPARPSMVFGTSTLGSGLAIGADGPARREEWRATGSNLACVQCPWCLADDDRVVDSRQAEEGAAIRRRRACNQCGHRYTTYERIEEVPLMVLKRSGLREPFDRTKVIAGLRAATKNRPVSEQQLVEVAQKVEDTLREVGAAPTTEQVGLAVLERLQYVDDVAYLRFASVYKGFEGVDDFRREVGLLTKTTAPKQPGPVGTSGASPAEPVDRTGPADPGQPVDWSGSADPAEA